MNKNDLSSIITRIERLEAEVFGRKQKVKKKQNQTIKVELDFSLNIRAFVKNFAANKSGSKKFTLLLAYLTKGELEKSVKLVDIKREWNKMKAKNLLDGSFNNFYTNDAKMRGWVDSKKYGTYCLSTNWQEAYK